MDLRNYRAVGIHDDGYVRFGTEHAILSRFAEKVPSGASVVVNYRADLSTEQLGIFYLSSGTALIPREEKLEQGKTREQYPLHDGYV